jgi:hypothetical protein
LNIRGYDLPESNQPAHFYFVKSEFGGSAYDKFLEDPASEFQTELKGNIQNTPLKKPTTLKVYDDGQLLLLRSFAPKDDSAIIDLVHIDRRIWEYSFKANPNNPDIRLKLGSPQKNDLAQMITGFQQFRREYFDYLSQVKAKKIK